MLVHAELPIKQNVVNVVPGIDRNSNAILVHVQRFEVVFRRKLMNVARLLLSP